MTLEYWITHTLDEFVGIANTLDHLKSISREEREKLYTSFRELYDADIIGTKAKAELDTLRWEAVGEPFKIPEDFREKLHERLEQITIPSKEEKSHEEIGGRLSLDYLMELASSYLTEASQYVLTEANIKNTNSQELIAGIRIVYAQSEHDEYEMIHLMASADLILEFNDSSRGTEYAGRALYEFVDFGDYLRDLKKEDAN